MGHKRKVVYSLKRETKNTDPNFKKIEDLKQTYHGLNEDIHNDLERLRCLKKLCIIYLDWEEPDDELEEWILKFNKEAEEIDEIKYKLFSLEYCTTFYLREGDFNESLNYANKYLKLAKVEKGIYLVQAYKQLGDFFLIKSENETAKQEDDIINSKQHFDLALNNMNLEEAYPSNIYSEILINLGIIHTKRQEYKLAEESLKNAIKEATFRNDTLNLKRSYTNLSILFKKKEEFDKCIHYINMEINLIDQSNLDKSEIVGCFWDLVDAYQKLESLEELLAILIKFKNRLKDLKIQEDLNVVRELIKYTQAIQKYPSSKTEVDYLNLVHYYERIDFFGMVIKTFEKLLSTNVDVPRVFKKIIRFVEGFDEGKWIRSYEEPLIQLEMKLENIKECGDIYMKVYRKINLICKQFKEKYPNYEIVIQPEEIVPLEINKPTILKVRIQNIYGEKEIDINIDGHNMKQMNFLKLKEIVNERYQSTYNIHIIIDYFYDENKIYSITELIKEVVKGDKGTLLYAMVSKFIGYTIEHIIEQCTKIIVQEEEIIKIKKDIGKQELNLRGLLWKEGTFIKFLTYFDKKYCNFEIQHINLNHNYLTDEFLTQFSKLQFINLMNISICNNSFSHHSILNFLSSNCAATLYNLDLSYLNLSKMNLHSFLYAIKHINALRKLNLSKTQLNFMENYESELNNINQLILSDFIINDYHNWLCFLKCFVKLEDLDLSYNTLNQSPDGWLIIMLNELASLRKLSLDHIKCDYLTTNDAVMLNHPLRLTYLDLSYFPYKQILKSIVEKIVDQAPYLDTVVLKGVQDLSFNSCLVNFIY